MLVCFNFQVGSQELSIQYPEVAPKLRQTVDCGFFPVGLEATDVELWAPLSELRMAGSARREHLKCKEGAPSLKEPNPMAPSI